MKTKPALPSLSINFDPLALMQGAKAPAPAPAQPEAPAQIVESAGLDPAPDPVPVRQAKPKAKRQPAPRHGMRQRGLWLSDAVMMELRIAALRQGTTASRLADEFISAALRRAS